MSHDADQEIYRATVHFVGGGTLTQDVNLEAVDSVAASLISGEVFKFGDERRTVLINPANVTMFEYYLK